MSETTFSIRKASALTGFPAKVINQVLATLPDDASNEQLVAAFVTAARADGTPATVLNVSQLNRITGLDRATIAKRLAEAKVAPLPGSKKKEKFFDIESSLAALVAAEGDGLSESKRKKTEAEAGLQALKLQRQRGDMMLKSEVREAAYNLVKAMRDRFIRYPREAKSRLKLTSDDVRTIETDFNLIFDDLNRDYPNIL